MNRQLIIHIGLPKTGSTAAQTFFARNREALLSHSIDYLPIGEFHDGEIGRIASGNGAYLARSMLPRSDGAYLRWEEDRVRDALLAAIDEFEREQDSTFPPNSFRFRTSRLGQTSQTSRWRGALISVSWPLFGITAIGSRPHISKASNATK